MICDETHSRGSDKRARGHRVHAGFCLNDGDRHHRWALRSRVGGLDFVAGVLAGCTNHQARPTQAIESVGRSLAATCGWMHLPLGHILLLPWQNWLEGCN